MIAGIKWIEAKIQPIVPELTVTLLEGLSSPTQKFRHFAETEELPASIKEIFSAMTSLKSSRLPLFWLATQAYNLMPTACAVADYHFTQSHSLQTSLINLFSRVPKMGVYAEPLLSRVSIPTAPLYLLFALPVIAHAVRNVHLKRLATHTNHLALLLLYMRNTAVACSTAKNTFLLIWTLVSRWPLVRGALFDVRHPGAPQVWKELCTDIDCLSIDFSIPTYKTALKAVSDRISNSFMNTFQRESLALLLQEKQWNILQKIPLSFENLGHCRDLFLRLREEYAHDSVKIKELDRYFRSKCLSFFDSHVAKELQNPAFILPESLEKTLRHIYGEDGITYKRCLQLSGLLQQRIRVEAHSKLPEKAR